MDKDFELEIQDEGELIRKKELEKIRAHNATAGNSTIIEAVRHGRVYVGEQANNILRPFFNACKFTPEENEAFHFTHFCQQCRKGTYSDPVTGLLILNDGEENQDSSDNESTKNIYIKLMKMGKTYLKRASQMRAKLIANGENVEQIDLGLEMEENEAIR